MDEVMIDQRLRQLEVKMAESNAIAVTTAAHNASAAEVRQTVILGRIQSVASDVKAIDGRVMAQNGRVAKLEAWRTQVTAIYGALLLAAPFVFYALSKWFE